MLTARYEVDGHPRGTICVVPAHTTGEVLYEYESLFIEDDTAPYEANMPKVGKHGKPTGMYEPWRWAETRVAKVADKLRTSPWMNWREAAMSLGYDVDDPALQWSFA